MARFDGKVVLISGAARGQGAAACGLPMRCVSVAFSSVCATTSPRSVKRHSIFQASPAAFSALLIRRG